MVAGRHERSLAAVVAGVHVGPGAGQQGQQRRVQLLRRQVQRGVARRVRQVRIRARLQEGTRPEQPRTGLRLRVASLEGVGNRRDRDVQGRPSVFVPAVHLGAGGDQERDDLGSARPRGRMQGGASPFVTHSRIGPGVQQGLDQHRSAVFRGYVQRRLSPRSLCGGIRPGLQQLHGQIDHRVGGGFGPAQALHPGGEPAAAFPEDVQERRVTILVDGVHVRARGQQRVDDRHGGRVAIESGPADPNGGADQRCAPDATGIRFDVGPGGQQGGHGGEAIVADGPVQRRESVVVASFQLRARGHQQRDDGPVLVGSRVVENGVATVVREVSVVVAGEHVRALLQAAGEVRSRGEAGEGARVPVLAVRGVGDPAAIVPREGVGAQPQQLAEHPRVERSPLAPGHVQGRQAEGAPGVGVGARFHQDGDDFRRFAPVGRQMQRRGPVRVPRVRIRAGVEALAHVVRGSREEEGEGVPVVAGVALLFRLPQPPNLGQAVQRLVVLGVVPGREALVVDGGVLGGGGCREEEGQQRGRGGERLRLPCESHLWFTSRCLARYPAASSF